MVRAGDRPTGRAVRLVVDPRAPSPHAIAKATSLLRQGRLVAFPTDTLYALGADASNPLALQRLFAAKGRSHANPIPLLVADLAMATRLVGGLSRPVARLAGRYWPGPLTLLLSAPPGASRLVISRTGRIGLRVPDSPLALALILRLGRPVTGTSANRSGGADPRDADEVFRQLGDRVDLVLDGGPVPLGSPSTVLDVTVSPPVVIREGIVSQEEIFGVLAVQSRTRKIRGPDRNATKAFGKRVKI